MGIGVGKERQGEITGFIAGSDVNLEGEGPGENQRSSIEGVAGSTPKQIPKNKEESTALAGNKVTHTHPLDRPIVNRKMPVGW